MSDSVNSGINSKIILMINAVAAFVGSYLTSAINIALPTIGNEFAAEAVLLGWVANAMMLSQAVTLIPAGRFADIFGRKKLFLGSMLLFAISSFLCAVSGSVVMLIVFQVFLGVGAGILIVTSVAVLTSIFPARERGKVIGVSVAATYMGVSAGPFLGGMLTQYLGWRSIYYVSAFLGVLVVVMTLRWVKGEWSDARGEKFDVTGSMVFILSLVMVIYGFTKLPSTVGIVLLVVGLAGMLVFFWYEGRIKSPILDIGQFRNNNAFIFSNLATLIIYCSSFAIAFLMSLYLQYIKGMSPQEAGLLFVVQPVVMTIVAPFAGRLSDRIAARKVAGFGMVLIFIALVFFAMIDGETSLAYIVGALAAVGLGMGLFSSPNSNAIMGSVEKKWLGVASGTVGTMRSCGMTLSLGIVMVLFSIYIGDVQITAEYYPAFLTSFRTMFTIAAALCFAGIFIQLAGRKSK